MTLSVAEEANVFSAGDNRTCSNRRDRENECSSSERTEIEDGSSHPYAMEVDRRRNCYACGEFGRITHHCRNRGQRGRIKQERRVEYRGWNIKGNNGQIEYLKEVENLESLN